MGGQRGGRDRGGGAELCRDVAWFSDTSLLTWSVWKEGAGIDAARPVAIGAARARQVLILAVHSRSRARVLDSWQFLILAHLRTLRAHVPGCIAYTQHVGRCDRCWRWRTNRDRSRLRYPACSRHAKRSGSQGTRPRALWGRACASQPTGASCSLTAVGSSFSGRGEDRAVGHR